jgi:hypothetical protein
MIYPDATSALAADRIRQYRAEAAAWRLARQVRAARAARAARPRSRPSSRAAPAHATPAHATSNPRQATQATECRG